MQKQFGWFKLLLHFLRGYGLSKKLIITEKPSVARDFARVLNVNGKRNGYIENDEYVISWCFGHLVEMVYPEVYDIKYKMWKLEDLPFLPETYQYGVIESSKEQYAVIHQLLYREDIDTVLWAGDSGKEGQTIEENIRNYGGVREGMQELRVWIDSQTDDEILRGIREARPMSDYARLGRSGIMRTIEDYSLGINFSRALSVKYGRMINDAAATANYTAIAIGRVMTCVLGMVVDREREIRNFVETPFYRVIGNFSDVKFEAEWKAIEGSGYFNSPKLYKENGFKKREDAEQLIEQLTGKEAIVENVEKTVSKKKAPLLFNLAELQAECSRLFKISPSDTLQIVQDLYEKKLTTYPRTDARVLTTAIAKEIRKNISGLAKYSPVSGFVQEILNNKKYYGIEKSSYTDDSKVTDHYAIIPTGYTNGIETFDQLHRSVYDLIVRRFLSIFYPPAEYLVVKIHVKIDTENFFANAKILQAKGYLEVVGRSGNADNQGDGNGDNASCSKEDLIRLTNSISKGSVISVNDYEIKEGKTSPPKRYTSGTLILAMENAGNLIEDEELREQIKNTGIGTSATRGEILEKLVRIKYLNQNSKTQIITPEKLGEMIYEVVSLSVPSLLNPEMTASWEKGLEGIINGTVDDVVYRKKLEDYIRRETTKMIQSDLSGQIAGRIYPFTGKGSKGMATRKPLGIPCPDCGGELTTTSFGYGCSNYFDKEKNCKFSVGMIAGYTLGEEDFTELITKGRTKVLGDFVGKNKKKFKASLVLRKGDDNLHKVFFDFSEVKPEILEGIRCPVCQGEIEITSYGYMCANKRNPEKPCSFSVGEIAGKHLSIQEFTELIQNGKTPVLSGFKSKNKKPFNAVLVFKQSENGQYSIEFDFSGVEPEFLEGVVCPDCGGRIYKKTVGFGCEKYNADDPQSCKFFIGEISKKIIPAAQVIELLNTGTTKTIRGFKSKNGKKFDACLKLQKNEENKTRIVFDFENVEAKTVKGVVCPICGGEIVKTSFGYGCKNYSKEDSKQSCRFNLGSFASVKLNDSQVQELLQNGITSKISGFKSKSGSVFEAKIALNKDENGNVTGCKFVFENEDKEMSCQCPICQGNIIKGRFGYRCSNHTRDDSGCKFYVGKIAGVELSEEQFLKLIRTKHTDVISGFQSKSGSSFQAALKFDENYNIIFEFPPN